MSIFFKIVFNISIVPSDFLRLWFVQKTKRNEKNNHVLSILHLANTVNYNHFIWKIYVLRRNRLFFSVWHILSTIQIWNCTYYNTKGKWEEKSIQFGQRGWVREKGISSLVFCFLFYFLGRVGVPGLKDDKKNQKQFTKSQSAKGCIS